MNTEVITKEIKALIEEHEDVTAPEMLVLSTILFDGRTGYCRYQIRRPGTIPVAAAVEFYFTRHSPEPINAIWLGIR